VRETALFAAGLRGADPRGAETALERFGLAPLADFPCRLLSAGQKKRLSLARLLAAPVELWLLDEPTTGLDAASTHALEAAIAAHRAGGGLAVVSTHIPLDLPGAATLSLADFPPVEDAAALWEDDEAS